MTKFLNTHTPNQSIPSITSLTVESPFASRIFFVRCCPKSWKLKSLSFSFPPLPPRQSLPLNNHMFVRFLLLIFPIRCSKQFLLQLLQHLFQFIHFLPESFLINSILHFLLKHFPNQHLHRWLFSLQQH